MYIGLDASLFTQLNHFFIEGWCYIYMHEKFLKLYWIVLEKNHMFCLILANPQQSAGFSPSFV